MSQIFFSLLRHKNHQTYVTLSICGATVWFIIFSKQDDVSGTHGTLTLKGYRGKEQNEHESISFADHESFISNALKNRYPSKQPNVPRKQSQLSSARNSNASTTIPTGFSDSGKFQIDLIHEVSDTNTLDESKENSYHVMKIGIYNNDQKKNFDYLYDNLKGNASISNVNVNPNANNSRNKGEGHGRGKFTAEDEDEDSLDIGSVATTNTLLNANSNVPYSEQGSFNNIQSQSPRINTAPSIIKDIINPQNHEQYSKINPTSSHIPNFNRFFQPDVSVEESQHL